MTREEAIEILLDMANELQLIPESKQGQAFKMAIDTMCKYQKIVMTIRNYDVAWEFHHMKPTIDKIREVIEDGNDT